MQLEDQSNDMTEKPKSNTIELPINDKKRIVSAIEQLPNGEDIKKLWIITATPHSDYCQFMICSPLY